MPALLEFGEFQPDVDYVLRPGGYAVICHSDGRVAVIKANRGYSLPGGGQDDDESPEQAAVREAYEECGLRIQVQRLIGTVDQLVFAASEQAHFRKRCTFFTATLIEQSGAGERDHVLEWMPLRDASVAMRHESQRWAIDAAGL